MSNFPLEQLLQMSPFEAMLIAYNEEHGTQLNPRFIAIDQILSSDGPTLSLRLKARTDLPNKDDQRFSNACIITVERLNFADLFTAPFIVPYGEAITSFDVGRNITQKTGVVFDENDFISDVITPDNPIVRAGLHSLRWYGELTVAQA